MHETEEDNAALFDYYMKLSRHEFVLIGTDFEYTKFIGVIEKFEYAPEAHDDMTANATVGNIELIETGNLLARHAADELPQISI